MNIFKVLPQNDGSGRFMVVLEDQYDHDFMVVADCLLKHEAMDLEYKLTIARYSLQKEYR